MYNVLNNCSYLSVSNNIVSRAFIEGKSKINLEGINSIECGIQREILISQKEYQYINKHKSYYNDRFILKCMDSEQRHNTQIVNIYSYIWNIYKKSFYNHINDNFWKVLTYNNINKISLNGLLLSVNKNNALIGMYGIVINLYFKRKFSYRNRYKAVASKI